MLASSPASPPAADLADTLPLWIAGAPRGRLAPVVAAALAAGFGLEEFFARHDEGYTLRDEGLDSTERSALLQGAALALRARGLVPGWRDEPCALLDGERELARFERGAFRTLGLRNRAVHVNGWLEDGRLWIARRSASKPSAPNKLDNLAAGLISAGESPEQCARRELWEEAGVPAALAAPLRFPGVTLHSLRRIAHGVHDELLFCADLMLPADFTPRCQDGEVQAFYRMTPAEVAAALARGEFSIEAGLVVADCLRRRGRDPR